MGESLFNQELTSSNRFQWNGRPNSHQVGEGLVTESSRQDIFYLEVVEKDVLVYSTAFEVVYFVI